ncbi:MAG: radical SAM family heme chaperone HemW [Pseudomonadota bacterium]
MNVSLYIHIPFCSAICHYCDFAKTANWKQNISDVYFKNLLHHVTIWVNWMKAKQYTCPTVFFGGGTPGLFTSPYEPILEIIKPVLAKNAEVSLEANPNNITESSLQAWKECGFTRLSLGIQSFQKEHLKFLSRDHSSTEAIHSIKLAKSEFPNLNIDLIYGIPGQTSEAWQSDLEMALSLDVGHLSLYNLTWEPQTVLGRRKLRKKIVPVAEDTEFSFYEQARKFLDRGGLHHEEVSNWSRPEYSCQHNWVYWKGGYYIGIGSGAHGFLPTDSPVGLRYSYPKNDRTMDKLNLSLSEELGASLEASGLILDKERRLDDLLLEIIGSSLRTQQGVPLDWLESTCNKKLGIHGDLKNLMQKGDLTLKGGYLTLDPKQWFMENYWAGKIVEGLK